MKRFGRLLSSVGLIGMMAFSIADVAAQDSGTTQLLVQSIYCADATGFASGDCAPASGVSVSAQSLDGGILGSCVTESGVVRESTIGYCYIEVPYGVDVLVSQDEATLSQEYVSTNNPQQVTVRAQGDESPDYIPTAMFINAMVAEAPQAPAPEPAPAGDLEVEEVVTAPVSSLPRTGTGPGAEETPVALMVAMGAVVAATLGAAARRCPAGRR